MALSRQMTPSPGHTPLHQTSFALEQSRTSSPLPVSQDGPGGNSRPFRGGLNPYFHPGCTLCSLIVSLPSDPLDPRTSSSRESSEEAGEGGATAGPSRPNRFLSAGMMDSSEGPDSLRRSSSLDSTGRLVIGGKHVLYFDQDITVYVAAGKERLCAEGKHLVVVLNRHVESVYDLSPADVPALSHMIDVSRRLLSHHRHADVESGSKGLDFRIGFVGSVIKDPSASHKHLHAHAMMGSVDTASSGAGFFRRNVVFGALNWWSIEDLRAEIREESSNNRVKSGYEDRQAPIDKVPDAGSVQGLSNALDPAPYSDATPKRPPFSNLGNVSASEDSPSIRRQGKGKMPSANLRLDAQGLPRETDKDEDGVQEVGHARPSGEYQPISL
ncbi:hypothetical protein BD324DRAFT_626988 [Kockovaella imperatae]|uniref:HIT domain-containing protein n=1 Tax=Kockovaella imperatae TaxID=4999 RepID=A0A1Y1UGT8_9TREE|nr:hypothetical protein BD324DRAFT_626988 [Kockovaella imperatae]ORX36737.1 hypothetical protein BD324DRAFT_626988 [Kockovaella imperatae]